MKYLAFVLFFSTLCLLACSPNESDPRDPPAKDPLEDPVKKKTNDNLCLNVKCGFHAQCNDTSGECVCDSDYHAEGDLCVSNRRMVPCDSSGIPENATPVLLDIENVWDTQAKEWSPVTTCKWECRAGYSPVGNSCHSTTKKVPCDPSQTPEHATAEQKEVTVLWDLDTQSWSETPLCDWFCNEQFHPEGKKCVANFRQVQCDASQTPDNAKAVVKTIENHWNTAAQTWDPIEPCSWSCKAQFHQIGKTCLADLRQVDCDSSSTPASAQAVVKKVEQTWNTTTKKWNAVPKCDWQCKSNFHLESTNHCVANSRQVTCDWWK